MIGSEYGFHNENDYSWVDGDSNLYKMRKLSVQGSGGDEKADEHAANI